MMQAIILVAYLPTTTTPSTALTPSINLLLFVETLAGIMLTLVVLHEAVKVANRIKVGLFPK